MKCEEMIREVYFVAGVLEGLSCNKGQPMTEASAFILGDCVDRLELVGAHLLKVCDPVVGVNCTTFDEAFKLLDQKKVIFDEGKPTEAFGRVYPAQEDTRADQ
jgi:hypothetical protein